MATEPLSGQWHDATILQIAGESGRQRADVLEFLQGYLTSDTERLGESALPTALCNLKGRVVANGWLVKTLPDTLGLVVHTTLADRVTEFLAPYLRFSKCNPAPPLERPVVANSAAIQENPDSYIHLFDDWYLVSPANDAIPDNSDIEHPDISAALLHSLLEQKVPWISAPVTEQFLPQVLELERIGAIDFDKGCYLGQEIVARAQFRGAVKNGLHRYDWHNEPPKVGAKMEVEVDPEDGVETERYTVVNICTDPTDASTGWALGVS